MQLLDLIKTKKHYKKEKEHIIEQGFFTGEPINHLLITIYEYQQVQMHFGDFKMDKDRLEQRHNNTNVQKQTIGNTNFPYKLIYEFDKHIQIITTIKK